VTAGAVWHLIASHIDANWIDLGSFILGGAYAMCTYRRQEGGRFWSIKTGIRWASGSAIFPLGVLVLAIASTWFIKELEHASRLTLTVAGTMSIFAILEDDMGSTQAIDA